MATGGRGAGELARPQCGPNAEDAVETALLTAAQSWTASGDRGELRRALLDLLLQIEHER
jgi:hypothetical protein